MIVDIVMRTAGAYRLILNALIVAGMTFELASENCLRFTYIDGIYMIKVCIIVMIMMSLIVCHFHTNQIGKSERYRSITFGY